MKEIKLPIAVGCCCTYPMASMSRIRVYPETSWSAPVGLIELIERLRIGSRMAMKLLGDSEIRNKNGIVIDMDDDAGLAWVLYKHDDLWFVLECRLSGVQDWEGEYDF